MNRPDFRTISDFRKRHLAALSGLFVQVLKLCQKAELVELGHVALDGTKMKANEPKRYRGGCKPKTPLGTPPDKSQRNFTDPESKIMKGRDGFIQGYNAQAAVDAKTQVIVAHGLTDCAADHDQLAPMVDAVTANVGQAPVQVSADSGYCSEANIQAMEDRQIDAFIAPGRQKHGEATPDGDEARRKGPKVEAMRQRLRDGGFDSPYRLRKQTVEPVFGQIKHARGFRQFLMRGIKKVAGEWAMLCTVHNILKLAARTGMAAA